MASKDTRTAQQRRDAQREALRKKRQAELRRQRNVRTAVIAVVVVLALLVVSVAGYFIWRTVSNRAEVVPPTGIAEDQGYVTVGAPEGADVPKVELHLDFMCPFCGNFDRVNGQDLSELVAEDQVTLNIVPRRALDRLSTTGDYSTRAASAAMCVYEEDPELLMPFLQAMYTNQPKEGSAGLTDEEIAERAQSAGASAGIADCIDNGTYAAWVRQVSEPYAASKADGTPYIEINGEAFTGDWSQPGAVRAAIEEAGPQEG